MGRAVRKGRPLAGAEDGSLLTRLRGREARAEWERALKFEIGSTKGETIEGNGFGWFNWIH